MTAQPQQDLIERLRKLRAMAEGAAQVGNAEEAAAFAAKFQELMLKHKIEMTDLEVEAMEAIDLIDADPWIPAAQGVPEKLKRIFWQEQLAVGVAHAHFCEIVVFPRSNHLLFVGRESDRKVAVFVYTVLSCGGSTAKKAAYREARRHVLLEGGGELSTKGFDRAFYVGYVATILARYRAERAAFEAAVRKQGQGTALVRLSTAVAQVNSWMDANMHLSRSRGPRAPTSANALGMSAGVEAGKAANLRPGGVGPAPAEKHLGPLPKQLGRGTP